MAPKRRQRHHHHAATPPARSLHNARDHPSLSDATLVLSLEDMIHATFGSEKSNKVDFKLFETVLTILGRRLNLLDQKVSIVDIDVNDNDSLTTERSKFLSRSAQMSLRNRTSVKDEATYILTAFLSGKTDKLNEQSTTLDTSSFLNNLDSDSKIYLHGQIQEVRSKTEGKFLINDFLKPCLDNLVGLSDCSINTQVLKDENNKIENSDYRSEHMTKAVVNPFKSKYHVLETKAVSLPAPNDRKKTRIEEEALGILGLLRSTFTTRKHKRINTNLSFLPPDGWPENLAWPPPPGTSWPEGVSFEPGCVPPPPDGWPEGQAWPPKPGTKWPTGVSWPIDSSKPLGWPDELPWPPPKGWPAGMPWPPAPGKPWPAGVSIPEGMSPPPGWPAGMPWPPTPGAARPSGTGWNTGREVPPPPQGWPAGMPWPPAPGKPWPAGVSIPEGMSPPTGWPAKMPWPPTPGTVWPSEAGWNTGRKKPPPPKGWPAGTPWPPAPGKPWPAGVSIPEGMSLPPGWPAKMPWPPTPGTVWPSEAGWNEEREKPPPPKGWPAGTPWPPAPGKPWPTGVLIPEGMSPPPGWPAKMPWPPTPGTVWPSGAGWNAEREKPPPPKGWPVGTPWPPAPGKPWPAGVSIPEGMSQPPGWPAKMPWPPTPGTVWPSEAGWNEEREKPPPPKGWPAGTRWPPAPGKPWPAGVSIPEGMSPPPGWPAKMPWPPTPGTVWPSEAGWNEEREKPPPPKGWPAGTPWPPAPGIPWPAGVSIPEGTSSPPGWPAKMPWPPTPGTAWPSEAGWNTHREVPPLPKGWPAGMPWPPAPGIPWPEGVSVPENMSFPPGWPAGMPWPPTPGTVWPSGAGWNAGTEKPPLPPPSWPTTLPWPPTPGTPWPVGVSIPHGMGAPHGWPADAPWPPKPGSPWPPGTSWPSQETRLGEARARRSTLQLTAQRVPSRTGSKTSTRVGTVECVTLSQFELLKKTVMDLKKISSPIPMPTMPVNQKLIKEVTAGNATLTDTMEAMKVVTRVETMEDAVRRLSEMVSALAAGLGQKMNVQDLDLRVVKPESVAATEAGSSPRYGGPMDVPCVSKPEMAVALAQLRERLIQDIEDMKGNIASTAENSVTQGKTIMDKLQEVVNINQQIRSLQQTVNVYCQQLEGLDAGINIQIKTFHDQLQLLKTDLASGLNLFANINNNKETLAVMDLTARYESLLGDMDGLLHLHSQLDDKQRAIADELRNLIHAVERVSEQKADHDELADGLKDKADRSTLDGLLTEESFLKAMDSHRKKLEACYDKFDKQDNVWQGALSDMLRMIDQKADYSQVFSWKDHTLEELRQLHCQVKLLAMAVGEPKAALLARQMAKDAYCGACAESAYMEVERGSMTIHDQDAARPETICTSTYKKLIQKEDTGRRRHMCKRWVGGSHTLVDPHVVTRGRAQTPDILLPPLRRYLAQANNGMTYHCASEMKACEECILPRPPASPVATAAPRARPNANMHRGGGHGSIHEVLPAGGKPNLAVDSVQTFVPDQSFSDHTPECTTSIVSRVRGVNSSLDIVATHSTINSERLG